jgi:elongation factor P--(R)-beta-lysine ligase
MLPVMDESFRERLRRHARFESGVRAFFAGRGFIEVSTPTLAPFLIPEPAIEVFRTEYLPARGDPRALWLIPSPELWMKRLLARGSGDIFQVSRSFRNADWGGPHHNPEFRLLEWYAMNADCRDAITKTEELVSFLIGMESDGERRAALARLEPPFTRLSMAEAFSRYARIDLAACADARAMVAAGRMAGLDVPADSTWEEAFHVAFLTLVEPSFPRDRPLVLTDYPALVPTTARRRPGTPWSERWELFIDGVEIANSYTEETDPTVLSALIAEETDRKAGARVPHDPDTGLAGAFPPGFPTCTGTALGLDRLEMVMSGEKSLEGVILFPFSAILPPQSATEEREESSDDQGQ